MAVGLGVVQLQAAQLSGAGDSSLSCFNTGDVLLCVRGMWGCTTVTSPG